MLEGFQRDNQICHNVLPLMVGSCALSSLYSNMRDAKARLILFFRNDTSVYPLAIHSWWPLDFNTNRGLSTVSIAVVWYSYLISSRYYCLSEFMKTTDFYLNVNIFSLIDSEFSLIEAMSCEGSRESDFDLQDLAPRPSAIPPKPHRGLSEYHID